MKLSLYVLYKQSTEREGGDVKRVRERGDKQTDANIQRGRERGIQTETQRLKGEEKEYVTNGRIRLIS